MTNDSVAITFNGASFPIAHPVLKRIVLAAKRDLAREMQQSIEFAATAKEAETDDEVIEILEGALIEFRLCSSARSQADDLHSWIDSCPFW